MTELDEITRWIDALSRAAFTPCPPPPENPMTTHSFHGDVHKTGLVDGCPRCTELADHLHQLDAGMIANLYERVRLNLDARSANEAIAMRRIHIARPYDSSEPQYPPEPGAPAMSETTPLDPKPQPTQPEQPKPEADPTAPEPDELDPQPEEDEDQDDDDEQAD
jgi:hypothetical protein